MKILILSSVQPNLNHEKSSSKVMMEFLKNISIFGHQASWATICCSDKLNKETEIYLKNLGIQHFKDFSDEAEIKEASRFHFWNQILTLRKCLIPFPNDDFPCFKNPGKVFNELKASDADVFLLYIDTWFENLLPFIKGVPVVGYWAKPRYSAPLARFNLGLGGNKIKTWLLRKFYNFQRKRNLKRARYFSGLSNLSALDAAEYRANGIPCQYIANTWADSFGISWQEKRKEIEEKDSKIRILANIGDLSATGNTFGLLFLSEKILPFLDEKLKGIDWEINICGPGDFSAGIKSRLKNLLSHPRVNIKGFVQDIDGEVLKNKIFLILNNAGVYTGGYTRAIYAFSSGSCLIAHEKITKDMPEIKNGLNALLGKTPEEIIGLIKTACLDENLRKKIGENGRLTYEQEYQPKVVVKKVINLCQSSLNSK